MPTSEPLKRLAASPGKFRHPIIDSLIDSKAAIEYVEFSTIAEAIAQLGDKAEIYDDQGRRVNPKVTDTPARGARVAVQLDNVAGHRARYAALSQTLAGAALDAEYVGGGDVHRIGFMERTIAARHHALASASVVDIGCGVGRLTRYLVPENLGAYLGTDVVPEALASAKALANDAAIFRFETVDSCVIPAEDASADIVCGFSVITHLLDEQIVDYFSEARRVLRPGGSVVFSYLDFASPLHQKQFWAFVRDKRRRHDLLKFSEQSTLRFFADLVGLKVVEVITPNEPVAFPAGSMLLNGAPGPAGDSFMFGQSLIYLTV
jgi:SAM-dependent methyltransferase